MYHCLFLIFNFSIKEIVSNLEILIIVSNLAIHL
jgi:hypothetical protein